jgi:serine/threonine protein kinase
MYLVMQLLEWQNLFQVLEKFPRGKILSVIKQLASAAKFLVEKHQVAHRDIKIDNIAVSPTFDSIVLLDFGVLKPIGISDLTDNKDQEKFIGTLRYGPPEFIFRHEEDNQDGWNAVTFYQIGAVIYDLIERKRLFHEISLFTRLIAAVEKESPVFSCRDAAVSPLLISLAKDCLQKDPKIRLKLVNWSRFEDIDKPFDDPSEIRKSIISRLASLPIPIKDSASSLKRKSTNCFSAAVERIVSMSRKVLADKSVLPPFVVVRKKNNRGIGIVLGPSLTHRVDARYALCFSIEVLDPDQQIISLDVQGCVPAPDDKSCSMGCSQCESRQNVFCGKIVDPKMLEEVERTLYRMTQFAITASIPGADEKESKKDFLFFEEVETRE